MCNARPSSANGARHCIPLTDGGRPDVNQLTQLDDFGPYVLVQIIAGIAIFVGLILCIIPGLIAAVLVGFGGYVVLDQHETDPIAAIKRSIELVKPKFGPIIGLLCLLFLINILGALIFRAIFVALGSVLMQYDWVVIGFGVFLVFLAGLFGLWHPATHVGEVNLAISSAGGLLGTTIVATWWSTLLWAAMLPVAYALLWPKTALRRR